MYPPLEWVNLLKNDPPHKLVAVELDDRENSMYPTIKPGDLLIVDQHDCPPTQALRKDGIYLLYVTALKPACLIKRVQQSSDRKFCIFLSDNSRYDPIVLLKEKWPHPFLGRIISSFTNHLQ